MSINDFKPNPDDITSIDGIDISEGCLPSNMNDAIRHVMSDLHDLVNKTDVTQSASGWMSSIDKIKLDGIEKATQLPKANGVATIGISTKYATEDHIHPEQTTVTGNAGTATKLETARTISLSGDVTGSVSFDGTENVSIATVVTDDSHNHIIANVDDLQTTLNTKAPLESPDFTGIPTAPTAVINTATTQIATTEFVSSAVNKVSFVGTKLESLPNTRTEILAKNTDFTVPSYKVGSNTLMVFVNGVHSMAGNDAALYTYKEMGTVGTMSTTIQFHDDIAIDHSIFAIVFGLNI